MRRHAHQRLTRRALAQDVLEEEANVRVIQGDFFHHPASSATFGEAQRNDPAVPVVQLDIVAGEAEKLARPKQAVKRQQQSDCDVGLTLGQCSARHGSDQRNRERRSSGGQFELLPRCQELPATRQAPANP